MHKSPELQYACFVHLSSLTETEIDVLKNEVEWIKEPAPDAHGDVHIVCNCVSSEHTAKMYGGAIDSLSSPLLGQYEASLIGKRNETVLDTVSKSQVKTMTRVYE